LSLTVFKNKLASPSSSCNIEEISHMMKSFKVSKVIDKKQHVH
jgi:hypothetical protein